jgi:transcriptional regulator with XRE-family HTH domain
MTDNWVQKLRKFLPARDHEILMLRYHEGLTLEEAGERMGITRERIRQIESRAIRRLQEETESKLLMENSKPLVGLRVSEFTDDQRPETKGSIVDNIDPLKILEQITLDDVERKIGELENTLDGWKAIYKIVAARSGVTPQKKTRKPRAVSSTTEASSSNHDEKIVAVLKEHGPLQPSEIADRVGISKMGMHFRLNKIAGISRRDDGAWEAA